MIDPQLPAEHAGHAIRWEPWQELAVCGRAPVPTECRLCGQASPHHRTLGRVDGAARASAERCTICGGVRAFWRDDPAPNESRGKLVPLCAGHLHRVVSEDPDAYGPCEDCNAPYKEPMFHCAGCLRRLSSGQECTTPRCQEQAAVLTAELRAAYPEAFTADPEESNA